MDAGDADTELVGDIGNWQKIWGTGHKIQACHESAHRIASVSDEVAFGMLGVLLDGRYRIDAQIARGGMSTVYRGVDTRLDRPVAIKVMDPAYADDPTFLARFSREAKLAATLSHPGVVAVYDHGRDGNDVFLVMELVDGGTVRDLLKERGKLTWPQTLAILTPLLDALAAAHAAGLVHRDVKPENVLISSKGDVKVADFGLVRAVTSQTMATGDVILGTVAYLSPEQVATGDADTRSDVYAAGVVAWEMLTGRPPFTGDTAISVAYQHVHKDVPPVDELAPEVPIELSDVISDATERTPGLRPNDAADFAAELRSVAAKLSPVPVAIPIPVARPTGPACDPRTPTRGAGAVSKGPAGTQVVRSARQPTATAPRASAGKRRWRRLIWLLVIIVLAIAAVTGGWWLGNGRFAYAPHAVGHSQQTAENEVRDAGLVPRVRTHYSDDYPAGQITGSDPSPGSKVLRGSTITLQVSRGMPRVPLLTPGSSQKEAEEAIRAAGLLPHSAAVDDVYDPAVPKGAVVRSDPPGATELKVGSQVTIIRSRGPADVQVPPVAGKAVEDARNALLVAGFKLGDDVFAFDAAAEDGQVLGTEPAAGQIAVFGSTVHLRIAHSRTVPKVREQDTNTAKRMLEQAGFTVTVAEGGEFDAHLDAGLVVRTDPAAGARTDPAHPAVTIYVSNAVKVPDLTRGTVEDARLQLATLGLKITVRTWLGDDTSKVVKQIPAVGSRVPPGSSVQVNTLF